MVFEFLVNVLGRTIPIRGGLARFHECHRRRSTNETGCRTGVPTPSGRPEFDHHVATKLHVLHAGWLVCLAQSIIDILSKKKLITVFPLIEPPGSYYCNVRFS